jgi:hypothetical protein
MLSYPYLNQIFYGNNKFDVCQNSIKLLEPYMFSEKRVSIFSKIVDRETESQILSSIAVAKTPYKWILPTQKNTLFWTLYIAKHGYQQYADACVYGSHNVELDEKQRIVDKLMSMPKCLKETNYKISNQGSQEIFGKLMVQNQDTLDLVVAYSVYYGFDIYIVFENTYLVYLPEVPDKESIIIKATKITAKDYSYQLLDTPINTEIMDDLVFSKVRMENWNKPLRGLSAYKTDELAEYAKLLGITNVDVGKKVPKQELYNQIIVKMAI